MRAVRPTLVVVSALWPVLVGCHDDLIRPEEALPSVEELSATLPPGIHAVVALPGVSDWVDGRAPVRIHLLAIEMSGLVQSYQGWIRFDPELVEVTAGTSPEGILGAWNEVAPGEIRFAGVSLDGVGDEHVIELDVRANRPLVRGDLSIALDQVIGTIEAKPFQDLTPTVQKSALAPVIAVRTSKP